jgi:hypothetical protein
VSSFTGLQARSVFLSRVRKRFVFEPEKMIRQNPGKIEPLLGVLKQVFGSIVERKFESRKGLA